MTTLVVRSDYLVLVGQVRCSRARVTGATSPRRGERARQPTPHRRTRQRTDDATWRKRRRPTSPSSQADI